MYRDDVEAARLRIAALESEIARLERENVALRRGGEPRRGVGGTVAVVCGVALAIGGTVAWARASGRSEGPILRPASAGGTSADEPGAVEIASTAPPTPAETTAPAAPAEAAASREPRPVVDPAFGEAAAAIAPAHPEEVEVLATRDHHDVRFVLYRWLGAVAWENAQRQAGTLERARADYEDRRTICEEGADEDDDEAYARCAIEEAPDRWVGARDAGCERAHAIDVARLEREGAGEVASWSIRGRARLVDLACDAGSAGARVPELRASDVDRDGHVELTALAPFEVPTTSMDTFESATIGAVLDGRDLHPQLVVLREYEGSYGDAEMTTRSAVTTWRLDGADGDGAIEAHIRQRIADVDDVARSGDARTADCPYDVAADRWVCAEAWARDPRSAAIGGSGLRALVLAGDPGTQRAARRR